jgi:tetratricopeptide (TPR) repeat protein
MMMRTVLFKLLNELLIKGCGLKRPVAGLCCLALVMGTGAVAQTNAGLSEKIAGELERIHGEEQGQLTPRQLGALWNMVAIDYQNAMELSRAEDAYGRSLRLLAPIPAAAPDYAAVLDNLGSLYLFRGRLSEAEACRKKALTQRQRQGNALDIALSEKQLAEVSLARHRFKDAEGEAAEALRIMDADPFHADNFYVVSTLMMLTYARCLRNDCGNGVKAAERAVMLAGTKFEPQSLPLGHALVALGFAKGKMGEAREADAMMLQGIQILKLHLVASDPRLLDALLQYRNFLAGVHRKAEAKQVEREVASLRDQHPSCNGCTVSVYGLSALSRK